MTDMFKWPTILSGLLCIVKLISPAIISWGWCFAPLWITLSFTFAFVLIVFGIALFLSNREKQGPKPFSNQVRDLFGKRYTTTTT